MAKRYYYKDIRIEPYWNGYGAYYKNILLCFGTDKKNVIKRAKENIDFMNYCNYIPRINL